MSLFDEKYFWFRPFGLAVLFTIATLPNPLAAQDIQISYSDQLAPIIDAGAYAYQSYLGEFPDRFADGKITIIDCGRNSPLVLSDLPLGYAWNFEGYESSESLIETIDLYALMMASFKLASIPDHLTEDVLSRLETRFGEYRSIYFDGVQYNDHGEALEVNLPSIFSLAGVEYPSLNYKDGCGGPLEIFLSTDPVGARIWRSTPLRASFCTFKEQNEDECMAWNEVTGQNSLLEQGNIILRARWPDGRETQSYRDIDNMSDPATIVLRPD